MRELRDLSCGYSCNATVPMSGEPDLLGIAKCTFNDLCHETSFEGEGGFNKQ